MEFDILYPERREDAFYDYNQFEKTFELWSSPQYLSDFYDQFKSFFQTEYWHGISEDTFLSEVGRSLNTIRRTIITAMQNNTFYTLIEPLQPEEEEKRAFESIRVKLKQGTIIGHYPFRFYAIEIEEKKCYLITGATIKVHKDMKKADNTEIELKKLECTLNHLQENGLDTKDIFVTQAL